MALAGGRDRKLNASESRSLTAISYQMHTLPIVQCGVPWPGRVLSDGRGPGSIGNGPQPKADSCLQLSALRRVPFPIPARHRPHRVVARWSI